MEVLIATQSSRFGLTMLGRIQESRKIVNIYRVRGSAVGSFFKLLLTLPLSSIAHYGQ